MNRLVLLVKDPTSLFLYWEVDDIRKDLLSRHFQSDWKGLPFFLQLYDVTDIHFHGSNAHHTRRMQVHPDSENWYIYDAEPNRRYLADFGTITLLGNFFAILRSNTVQTPPLQSSRDDASDVVFRHRGAPVHPSTAASLDPSISARDVSREEMGTVVPYSSHFDGYTIKK